MAWDPIGGSGTDDDYVATDPRPAYQTFTKIKNCLNYLKGQTDTPFSGTGVVRATAGVASVVKLKRTIGIMIGDGVNVIPTGVQGYFSTPVNGTIVKVRLLSTDASVTSGSIVLDIWKDTYANYPPTNSDSITASAQPTISSATKSEDSTLNGWSTSVVAGDVFGVTVDSVSSLKRVLMELTLEES